MSQNISHGVAIGNHGCSMEENIMPKVLNNSQSQFIDMSIMGLSIEEIAAKVINDMFMTFIVVLH